MAIGRMIKYNIPRFLRLTDVTDDNYSNTIIYSITSTYLLCVPPIPPFLCEHNLLCLNLSARLIGALRLLCRLSSSSRQRSGPVADAVISDDSISAWRDPAVVSALVSFLPRSVRFGQHQVMMMTCHSVFYDDRFSS